MCRIHKYWYTCRSRIDFRLSVLQTVPTSLIPWNKSGPHVIYNIIYYLWCPIMPTTRLEQDFDRFECSVPVTPSHNTSMRLGRNSQSQSHRCWPYYYRYIRAASSIGTAPRLTAFGHNPFSNPVRRPLDQALNLFFGRGTRDSRTWE